MKLPLRPIALIVCAVVLLSALCLGLSVYAYDVTPMDKMGLVVTESSDLNIRSGPNGVRKGNGASEGNDCNNYRQQQ